MFEAAYAFNQPLEKWDVSNVTNMGSMFEAAYAFNQPLEKWDVSHVTDMNSMFKGARSFNHSLSYWDMSRVLNDSLMFDNAVHYNERLENACPHGIFALAVNMLFERTNLPTSIYEVIRETEPVFYLLPEKGLVIATVFKHDGSYIEEAAGRAFIPEQFKKDVLLHCKRPWYRMFSDRNSLRCLNIKFEFNEWKIRELHKIEDDFYEYLKSVSDDQALVAYQAVVEDRSLKLKKLDHFITIPLDGEED